MKTIVADGLSRQKLFVVSGVLGSEADRIAGMLEKKVSTIIKRWEADNSWQTILSIND